MAKENVELKGLKTIKQAQAEMESSATESVMTKEDIKAIVNHTEGILQSDGKAQGGNINATTKTDNKLPETSDIDSNVASDSNARWSPPPPPVATDIDPVSTDVKADMNTISKQERYNQILQASAKQETWILLDEFLRLSGLDGQKVQELIESKGIKSKQENGMIYVEANTGTSALIKKVESKIVSLDMNGKPLDPVFVEKTIATILGLHDKVISSKDETIAAIKNENSFLKEALVSMQEIYDDDKKTIEILREQLQRTQEEVEFVKRKYKLMWGRVSNSAT